jgi:hypothetical protein
MRWVYLAMLVFILGCRGPLNAPMVTRLPPEDQQQVDDAWRNMLTPVDRLDRTLLLDVLLTGYYYQLGVDRLDMTAVKRVSPYRVVMEIHYDRDEPEFDAFTVAVLSADGREVRHERYSREDVEGRLSHMYLAEAHVQVLVDEEKADRATLTAEQRAELERLRVEAAEWPARKEEIAAATRPAGAR